jgi:hypothetical protein
MAGLPPFISFSTSYPELNSASAVLRHTGNERFVGNPEVTIGPSGVRQVFAILSAVNPPILLGTSSFTAAGWNRSFCPRGMKPSDYLALM